MTDQHLAPSGAPLTATTTRAGDEREALLPCPFCGSSATGPHRNYYEHAVNDCLFSGFKISASSPRDIAAWNRRAAAFGSSMTDAQITEIAREHFSTGMPMLTCAREFARTLFSAALATTPTTGQKLADERRVYRLSTGNEPDSVSGYDIGLGRP